jgi:hypothetical protein
MLASTILSFAVTGVAMNIQEPARNIPVIREVDLCILGLLSTSIKLQQALRNTQ